MGLDPDLEQLVTFIQTMRPQWKFIIEDMIVRACTEQFVIDWGLMHKIEDMKKYEVSEIIFHQNLGQIIVFRPLSK